MKASTVVVQKRFREVFLERLEAWDKENPEPNLSVEMLAFEIKKGKVSVDTEALKRELGESSDYINLFKVLDSKSLAAHRSAQTDRALAREQFKAALSEAKDAFLDRVIFDHENAFLLLRDLKRWRPEMR